jgi:hypothetical protein
LEKASLLTAADLRDKIGELLSDDVESIFLSAYFTAAALRYIHQLVPNKEVQVAIRARPLDFKFGSSDIGAVRQALELGWDIRFISSLHAKAYLIGDKVLVGSGNLTSNGLHLMGSGNLELNCLVDADLGTKDLVRIIFREARRFDIETLEAMEKFLINPIDVEQDLPGWWPENIVPIEMRKLFCCDFPQLPIDDSRMDEQVPWEKVRRQLAANQLDAAAETLSQVPAIIWLRNALRNKADALRFGELTAMLHDELAEDPAPYRREVKQLLANLLSYVKFCPHIGIEITRPRHTEIVRLVE